MAAPANTVTSAQVCRALDIDFVESFTSEFNKLFELLGMFPVETIPAGAAVCQYAVTGTLADAPAEGESTPTGPSASCPSSTSRTLRATWAAPPS